MVRLPLNIMCSKRWAMPVAPTSSLTDPTWAVHPAETVGLSCRSTINSFIPLSRNTSWTGTLASWAVAVRPPNRTTITSAVMIDRRRRLIA